MEAPSVELSRDDDALLPGGREARGAAPAAAGERPSVRLDGPVGSGRWLWRDPAPGPAALGPEGRGEAEPVGLEGLARKPRAARGAVAAERELARGAGLGPGRHEGRAAPVAVDHVEGPRDLDLPRDPAPFINEQPDLRVADRPDRGDDRDPLVRELPERAALAESCPPLHQPSCQANPLEPHEPLVQRSPPRGLRMPTSLSVPQPRSGQAETGRAGARPQPRSQAGLGCAPRRDPRGAGARDPSSDWTGSPPTADRGPARRPVPRCPRRAGVCSSTP